MNQHANRLMLLYVFTGLGAMLFLFRDSPSLANGCMLSVGIVVGAACNMAQGKIPPPAAPDPSIPDPNAKPTP